MKDSLNYDDHTHTEYSGRPGFEKKLHKTHFAGTGRHFRTKGNWPYEWVEIGPGRWKRVRKEKQDDA